jgi:dihydroneopterin aldolase
VVDAIQAIVAHRPRKLIEAMANDVASEILARKWAQAVTVEVKKFSIPAARYVAVEIYREQ